VEQFKEGERKINAEGTEEGAEGSGEHVAEWVKALGG
jgi:hypothetical protein